jgi:hypothetical protein
VWGSNLHQAIRFLQMTGESACRTIVYIALINRYLLLTWKLHQDYSAKNWPRTLWGIAKFSHSVDRQNRGDYCASTTRWIKVCIL